MAGLTPVANQMNTPGMDQYKSVLSQARTGFAGMSPSQQLATTRFLNATNHDLIRATRGQDPRLSASSRYVEAAENLEEAKKPELAAKLLAKADMNWDAAAGIHNRIPPAIRPVGIQTPGARAADPRETNMQQHLMKIAMPIHEGPSAQPRAATQNAQ